MTAMLGMTELLQLSELDDAQKEYAVTIERSGQSLLQLVNDILDFSKVEAGQLRLEDVRLDLRELLDDVKDMLSIKARQRRLRFEVEVAPGTPLRYRGDPTRLKQVLVNLVGNAIKFTPKGEVRIVARSVEARGQPRLVEIDVTDTGIGIAAEQLDNVFEAFTQADASTTRKFGGTGLGLTISNQLVRLMGGELRVRSELGAGSTFTASLPLSLSDARHSMPAPAEQDRRATYCGRVLLVEDNPDNQNIAREMLRMLGIQVELANDGQQALACLEQSPYDVVFMDCHMPNMNGFDATREIRRREQDNGKHIPIVALTASVLPEERDRCMEVGMDDYVAKPFSRKDLQQVLDRWLAA
jgi:CheY-like chemotaxis protein